MAAFRTPAVFAVPQHTTDTDVVARHKFIVFRPAAGLPPGAVSESLDGFWMDLGRLTGDEAAEALVMHGVRSVPVMRFETREDGAVAQVYEATPLA